MNVAYSAVRFVKDASSGDLDVVTATAFHTVCLSYGSCSSRVGACSGARDVFVDHCLHTDTHALCVCVGQFEHANLQKS